MENTLTKMEEETARSSASADENDIFQDYRRQSSWYKE
jgi:hypothetical protein